MEAETYIKLLERFHGYTLATLKKESTDLMRYLEIIRIGGGSDE